MTGLELDVERCGYRYSGVVWSRCGTGAPAWGRWLEYWGQEEGAVILMALDYTYAIAVPREEEHEPDTRTVE